MHAAEQEYATLRVEQEGRVLIARVVAPPFNYMTPAMQADVSRLVRAVELDPGVGAVVLTGGVPGRYITHFDIGHLSASAESSPRLPRPVASGLVRAVGAVCAVGGEPVRRTLERTPLASLVLMGRFRDTVRRILRSPAVWIAAVDGPCGGGGLELSVFFDARLATPRSVFVLPELSIGLTTTFGGQRLAALAGPSRALRMLLDARAFDATEMRGWGVVDEVVEGDVVARARELGGLWARRPRAVVAAQKEILHDPDAVGIAESLRRESVAQAVGVPSTTTRAALRAWLDRRPADGESTFLAEPEAFAGGQVVNMNP